MKLLFTVCILLFAALCSRAQDVIHLQSGDSISAKVFRIDTGTVKYLLADTIGARIHAVQRDSVKYIRFANGSIYTLPTATDPYTTPHNSLRYREKVLQYEILTRKQKQMRLAGLTCLGISGGLLLNMIVLLPTGVAIEKRNPDVASGLFITGAMGFVASIPTGIIGGVYLKKARKAKLKLEQEKVLLGFAPYSRPVTPAGNIYGIENGIALRINF